jgi:transcriptional regulator with XRE-family HTH domain
LVKFRRGSGTAAIDRHVGARIRQRRIVLGLTQQQFAELIGVTYQQVHKIEHGITRVSAGRLFEIAEVLNVPMGFFYEGIGEEKVPPVARRERMMREIARNFAAISDERHQEVVNMLARVLSGTH